MNQALLRNEALEKIATFIKIVKDCFHYKTSDDVDVTIAKLKAVKEMSENGFETDELNELSKLAKETKDLNNHLESYEYDERDDSDYYNDDLPDFYQGEDGELIFKT